ncbi:MAG: chemotaxis protein [Proteobacteria bacterium]|nr:chemotaxis protein [Pseudomonadota bacterium]
MTFYRDIEKFLSETFGFDPESIGRKNIADAVNSRMRTSVVHDMNHYLEMLKSHPEELEKLVEQVVVPETWFFRDRESFNFLKKHIEKTGHSSYPVKTLRILSVPCSTGEEPYSIAMALLEAGLSPERFHIDAVDISHKAIGIAKRAVYGKGSFRGENRDYQYRYFTPVEEGFKLDRAVAGLVHFYRDNFVQPYALRNHESYQGVFCKNLLIYLTDDARKKVFANLDRLLVPEGVVFTGHSEMMSFLQYGYNPVKHSRSFACRKADNTEKTESGTSIPALPTVTASTVTASPAKMGHGSPTHRHREETAPDAVLTRVRTLADRGKLKEALKLCEQFLKEHSDNKEAYYLMGLINLALDSFVRAEDFFQKALYLDPCYYEALLHMSLLYEKRDDQARASIIRERIKRFQEKD